MFRRGLGAGPWAAGKERGEEGKNERAIRFGLMLMSQILPPGCSPLKTPRKFPKRDVTAAAFQQRIG